MSEFRYSPEPASFYTFKFGLETVGLGSGYSILDNGFWNLVWLTCPQCDEFEKPPDMQDHLPVWSEDFQKPYLETASTEIAGSKISEISAVLKAETFVHFLAHDKNFKALPLYREIGPAWLISILDRSKKSADIRISDHTLHQRVLPPNRIGHDLTPQTLTRGKVIKISDWLAKLPGV